MDPGAKNIPLCEPALNFSASRILSSGDHFMTEVVFSKCIPEKNKALYLVLLTFWKVITSCVLLLYFRDVSAQHAGLAHPADEQLQVECHIA